MGIIDQKIESNQFRSSISEASLLRLKMGMSVYFWIISSAFQNIFRIANQSKISGQKTLESANDRYRYTRDCQSIILIDLLYLISQSSIISLKYLFPPNWMNIEQKMNLECGLISGH